MTDAPLYLVLSATEATDHATLTKALEAKCLGGLMLHVCAGDTDFTQSDGWLAATECDIHLALSPLPVPANPPFQTVTLDGVLYPVPNQVFLAWWLEQLRAYLQHLSPANLQRLKGFRVCFSTTYAGDAEFGVLGASLANSKDRYETEWQAAGYTPVMLLATMKEAAAALETMIPSPILSVAMFDSGHNMPRIDDTGNIEKHNAGPALADALYQTVTGISANTYAVDTVYSGTTVTPFAEAAANESAGLLLQLATQSAPTVADLASMLEAAQDESPAWIELHVNQMAIADAALAA